MESNDNKSCISSQLTQLRSYREGRSGSVNIDKGYFRNAIAENILKKIPLINEEFKNSLESGKKTEQEKMPRLAGPSERKENNKNRWVNSENKEQK